MYWCDAETDRVEKANLDGSGREIVIEDPGSHFFGITLDETYLYVTDWAKRWVLGNWDPEIVLTPYQLFESFLV